jgi:hypothetical protein
VFSLHAVATSAQRCLAPLTLRPTVEPSRPSAPCVSAFRRTPGLRLRYGQTCTTQRSPWHKQDRCHCVPASRAETLHHHSSGARAFARFSSCVTCTLMLHLDPPCAPLLVRAAHVQRICAAPARCHTGSLLLVRSHAASFALAPLGSRATHAFAPRRQFTSACAHVPTPAACSASVLPARARSRRCRTLASSLCSRSSQGALHRRCSAPFTTVRQLASHRAAPASACCRPASACSEPRLPRAWPSLRASAPVFAHCCPCACAAARLLRRPRACSLRPRHARVARTTALSQRLRTPAAARHLLLRVNASLLPSPACLDRVPARAGPTCTAPLRSALSASACRARPPGPASSRGLSLPAPHMPPARASACLGAAPPARPPALSRSCAPRLGPAQPRAPALLGLLQLAPGAAWLCCVKKEKGRERKRRWGCRR